MSLVEHDSVETMPVRNRGERMKAAEESSKIMKKQRHTLQQSTYNKTYVMIPKQLNNPFFDEARQGCEYQANLLSLQWREPIFCEYLAPAGTRGAIDVDDQVSIVRQLLESSLPPSGIAISVVNAEQITPILIEARQAGISVVTFDSDSLRPGRRVHIGTDNHAMGQSLAKLLQQLRPYGGIYGLISDTAPNTMERERGFREYLVNFEHWIETPTSPLYCNDSIQVALDQMEEFALLQPHIDAIVSVGGWSMFDNNKTRYQDFVNMNRNLTLVSGDMLPVQVELLRANYSSALVGQEPFQMGAESIKALYFLTRGDNYDDSIINDTITLTSLMELVRVPLVLPPLNVDQNYIRNMRFVGISLYLIVAVAAMFCIGWTFYKRKVRVVKASQPVFLILIAVGAFILGSALVPLTFDDSSPDYNKYGRGDRLCMTVPWLGCVGFAIAFSALFSKTWRINKLFHSSRAYTRITVRERDVMIPLVVIVGCNVIVLLCWTLLDPLKYIRQPYAGTDGWNRVIAFYGTCRSERSAVPYMVSLAVIDFGLLVISNWQAYEARSIQSEFAESRYIAVIMVVLLQSYLTGLPILFLVKDNPRPFYMVLVFMIFVISMATLLLIFVPKVIYERDYQRKTKSQQDRQFHAAMQQHGGHEQKRSFLRWSEKLRRHQQQQHNENRSPVVNDGTADDPGAAPNSDPSACEAPKGAEDGTEDSTATTSRGGLRIFRESDGPIVVTMGDDEPDEYSPGGADGVAVQRRTVASSSSQDCRDEATERGGTAKG